MNNGSGSDGKTQCSGRECGSLARVREGETRLISAPRDAGFPNDFVSVAGGPLNGPQRFVRLATGAIAAPGLAAVRKHVGGGESGVNQPHARTAVGHTVRVAKNFYSVIW